MRAINYRGDPDDEEARYEYALKHQREYTKRELMFDWDLFGGVLETYKYDSDTGDMLIKREFFGMENVLDDNAEWRAAEQNWRKKDDKWIRYASIPMGVVELWLQEGINVLLAETDRNGVPNEHLKAVYRKLRDPQWQFLKTVDMDMGDGNQAGMTRLGVGLTGENSQGAFPTLPEDLLPPKQPKALIR